jgi:hypothetical protein
MPKAILYAQSAPASPEREAEFNEWYDSTHAPEILALPGFVSCRRFKCDNPPEGVLPYVAIYEIESDDPQATVGGIMTAIRAGQLNLSDSIAAGAMVTYTEI